MPRLKVLILSYLPFRHPIDGLLDSPLMQTLQVYSEAFEVFLVVRVKNETDACLLRDTIRDRYLHVIVYPVVEKVYWEPKLRRRDYSLLLWLRGIIHLIRVMIRTRKMVWIYSAQFFFCGSHLFEKVLRGIFFEISPDLIYFQDTFCFTHFDVIPRKTPRILYYGESLSGGIYWSGDVQKKIRTKLALWKAKKWEQLIFRNIDMGIVFSLKDKEWLQRHVLAEPPDILISHVGIDHEYFSATSDNVEKASVMCLGKMHADHNVSGVKIIATEILPKVRKTVPHLKFFVVGMDPTPDVSRLSQDPLNVVTGYVEDLRPYFTRAAIFLNWSKIRIGIRSRILLAMSMGKAVITTSEGLWGIEGAVDGRNVLVANDVDQFADKIIMMIHNKKMREDLGSAARQLIIEQYSLARWKSEFMRASWKLLKDKSFDNNRSIHDGDGGN